MSKKSLNAEISEDRRRLTLSLTVDGAPSADIVLEASELDELIHNLASFRASMPEPVPMEIGPGTRSHISEDPVWRTRPPDKGDAKCVLLALRHPGLGWVMNVLPLHEARQMGLSLVDLSARSSA